MPRASMFTRPPEGAPAPAVSFRFEGERLSAPAGISVAAALLLAGAGATRTSPVSGTPRAPYCMMGVCFECLVVIDGEPDHQACMVEIRDGMDVRRQHGAGTYG